MCALLASSILIVSSDAEGVAISNKTDLGGLLMVGDECDFVIKWVHTF